MSRACFVTGAASDGAVAATETVTSAADSAWAFIWVFLEVLMKSFMDFPFHARCSLSAFLLVKGQALLSVMIVTIPNWAIFTLFCRLTLSKPHHDAYVAAPSRRAQKFAIKHAVIAAACA